MNTPAGLSAAAISYPTLTLLGDVKGKKDLARPISVRRVEAESADGDAENKDFSSLRAMDIRCHGKAPLMRFGKLPIRGGKALISLGCVPRVGREKCVGCEGPSIVVPLTARLF